METRTRKLPRAYRAGRAMTAMGRWCEVGEIVPGAHRSVNLAECISLGYLIKVEEDELSDEERAEIEADAIAEQAQRHREAHPGHVVTRAGESLVDKETGHPVSSDVILQDSGRLEELRRGEATAEAAQESAARGRRARGTGEAEATPAAQEAADELDVDLEEVEGSGREGRVTKADVEEAARTQESPSSPPERGGTGQRAPSSSSGSGGRGNVSDGGSRPPQQRPPTSGKRG